MTKSILTDDFYDHIKKANLRADIAYSLECDRTMKAFDKFKTNSVVTCACYEGWSATQTNEARK